MTDQIQTAFNAVNLEIVRASVLYSMDPEGSKLDAIRDAVLQIVLQDMTNDFYRLSHPCLMGHARLRARNLIREGLNRGTLQGQDPTGMRYVPRDVWHREEYDAEASEQEAADMARKAEIRATQSALRQYRLKWRRQIETETGCKIRTRRNQGKPAGARKIRATRSTALTQVCDPATGRGLYF